MANWHPASESPEPPDWFVRELKRIDPTLRVIWGMERYLRAEWAVERKTDPERYWEMYAHVLSDLGPRFVEQPVFDEAQPLGDENGNPIGFKQVGTRKYDLAPEYEYVAFRPTLDNALLTLIKKLYWERDHPEQAAAAYKAADEARAEAKLKKRMDAAEDGIGEALLETRKIVQFGHGPARSENKVESSGGNQ